MALLATAPAGTQRSRWQRVRTPLATVGGLALATVALHLRDPHVQGSWGICPSRLLFGLDCPGCGGLRAVNDLGQGDLMAAASSNLLFVVSVPLIVAALGWWLVAAWRRGRRAPAWLQSQAVLWAFVAVTTVFTVARNLPAGAWLGSTPLN